MAWSRKKLIQLFAVLFVHVTLLDLFFITYNGPVFMWEQNGRLSTLISHLVIATMSVLFYLFLTRLRIDYQAGKFKIGERIWFGCSFILILSIGFVLF